MPDTPTDKLDPRDLKIAEQAKLIAELVQENERLVQENKELKERIERLESLLATKAESKASKKPVFTENYSLDRNKLGRSGSGNSGLDKKPKPPKPSTGRKPQQSKEHLISDTVKAFPPHVSHDQCVHHRFQSVWRIVDGKAVYLRYDIHDRVDSRDLPLPPGVRNSRSEFGIEIILILGFLHYWIGVSQANAIDIMKFFSGLDLAKSQADSLLSQLADDWEKQHDAIADLIAIEAVVYIDETGWKVGAKSCCTNSCYTWVFSTAQHVLFRCGVSRKKTEATDVLGDFFEGIGVTDDHAAYKNLFSEHQLCWAHLIRKAIKLVLQNPDQTQYAEFLDQLCGIYHDAKELRAGAVASVVDQPPHDALGREAVAAALKNRITALCSRSDEKIISAKSQPSQPPVEPTPAHVEAFVLLQREMASNLDCLFVFVEHPDVEPTNNRSERNVRREAEIRKGSRTSKTVAGAKRRSIIVSVLASLQTRIADFTLSNLLQEVRKWSDAGASLFELELKAATKSPPPA